MTRAANIDEVITLLDPIIDGYLQRGSVLALFPSLYRVVTRHVRDQIERGGFFDDGPRMGGLDTSFANRYFAAYDEAQARREVTRSWQEVFDAENRSGLMMLQHLLLGMSAHINFDLSQCVANLGPDALPSLRNDFERINQILGTLLDRVQDVLDRFSPFLKLLDRMGGEADEAIANFSIDVAREEAWHEANRLAAESPDLRARSIEALDRKVALLARNIIVPGGPAGLAIGLIASTERRDVAAVAAAIDALG